MTNRCDKGYNDEIIVGRVQEKTFITICAITKWRNGDFMKKAAILWMLILSLALLGCQKSGEIEKNNIQVSKKGWVKATVHESFDKEYYDKEELQETIESAIEAYNSESGEERIKLDSLKVKKKVAHLTITYTADDDYEAFNQVGIFNGTVKEMDTGLYNVRQELEDSDGNKIPLQNLLVSDDTFYLVILQEDCTLETSGKILYSSSNVTLDGKKTADVTANHASYAYIVYE